MFTCSNKSILFFFIFFFGFSSFSQDQKGTVKGQIADFYGPISGAYLRIDSLNIKVISNVNGEFYFFNLDSGKYNLTIQPIGYIEKNVKFEIKSSDILDLGQILIDQVVNLEEVLINTKRNNSVNQIKSNINIVYIKNKDEIHKLPVKNAADIASRLPSVSLFRNKGESSMVSLRGTPTDWTAVLINGDRLPVACEDNTTRSFEFEAFPSDFVDQVVESKTVTPDLESDNIGGSINFLTKPAVTEKLMEINIAAGFNFLAKKPTGTFSFIYGNLSKNKKWSFISNLTYFGRNYASDAYKIIYGSNLNHSVNRLELRRYDGLRTTVGAHTSLQYKLNSKIKIESNLFCGFMQDDKNMKKQSFNWYDDDGQRLRLQNTKGILNRKIVGGDLCSEINLSPKVKLELKVASYSNQFKFGQSPFSKNDSRNGFFVTEFMSPMLQFQDFSAVDIKGNIPDINSTQNILVKLIGDDNPYSAGDSPLNVQPKFSNILTPEMFHFSNAYTEINHTREGDPIVCKADLEYTLNNKIKLQFGAKFRHKIGFRNISKHGWLQDFSTGNSTPILLTDFSNQLFSVSKEGFLKELGANYEKLNYPMLSDQSLSNFLELNQGRLREVEMNKLNYEYYQWVGSNYNYTENQHATYAMITYSYKKVAFLTGFRIENTHLRESSDTLTSNIAFDSLSGTYFSIPETRTIQRRYIGFLPSFNLNYYINKTSTLHLAVSRTMHRPNFEETKPGAAVIRFNDLEYTFGNPNLKPVFSSNFDISYDKFWGNKGMFSIGLYFKNIENHIFSVVTNSSDVISGITMKRFENANNSWVSGIELLFNKNLDFISSKLKRFEINSNLTYSISRMKVKGRENFQAMTEQTPLLYNLSLSYEGKKLAISTGLLYNGKCLTDLNLASIGGELLHKNSDFDIYLNSFYSLDLMLTFQISKHANIYLEMNNLLNSPERKYVGKDWRVASTEYYRSRSQLGIKFEF